MRNCVRSGRRKGGDGGDMRVGWLLPFVLLGLSRAPSTALLLLLLVTRLLGRRRGGLLALLLVFLLVKVRITTLALYGRDLVSILSTLVLASVGFSLVMSAD